MTKKRILILEDLNINKNILINFDLIFKKFKNKENLRSYLFNQHKKNPIFAIFCSFGFYFDKKIFGNLNYSLKYIISPTTGLDHINLDECKKNNIQVISLYNQNKFLKNVKSTAELTWAMILNLSRNINEFSNDVIVKSNWNRNLFLGSELNEKNLGIIGYGRIGQIVSRYGKTFGMSLYSYEKNTNLKKRYKEKINFVSLKKLFSICDIITIHIPLKENYNFITKKLLKNITKNVVIINTSRGEIFEKQALLYSIKNKKIKGLGLDVLPGDVTWKNKIDKKYKFLKKYRKKLILTPHIGGNTLEARIKTTTFIINKFLNKIKN